MVAGLWWLRETRAKITATYKAAVGKWLVSELKTGQKLADQCLGAAMQLAWWKQLKANKHWFCIVSKNWLGHLLICDLCISWIGCSKIWMRGLTTLELKLGNAFGKTEDVLDEDSVVPLAWQVRGGGGGGRCRLRGETDYIIWREVFLGRIMIYLHAMYVMSCCYELKRNKTVSLSEISNSLQQALCLKSSVCLPPYTGVPPAASFRLSPLLRYLKDTMPCLYLGLWLSVDLRVSRYQLPK